MLNCLLSYNLLYTHYLAWRLTLTVLLYLAIAALTRSVCSRYKDYTNIICSVGRRSNDLCYLYIGLLLCGVGIIVLLWANPVWWAWAYVCIRPAAVHDALYLAIWDASCWPRPDVPQIVPVDWTGKGVYPSQTESNAKPSLYFNHLIYFL